jgi:hypothetical protein
LAVHDRRQLDRIAEVERREHELAGAEVPVGRDRGPLEHDHALCFRDRGVIEGVRPGQRVEAAPEAAQHLAARIVVESHARGEVPVVVQLKRPAGRMERCREAEPAERERAAWECRRIDRCERRV